MPEDARIKLVTCIGVNASVALVGHFVEHYRRLGVSELLVILHAGEGDPRREPVLRRLAELGIEPVLEIGLYSAPRKRVHIADVIARHCSAETWVLHADVDEFQVYPSDLESFLDACARRRRSFVRGRLIDRLAPGGELREIRRDSPIWEQFPLQAAAAAALSGGWQRKVCAARASVALADGGAHAVELGLPHTWNYRLTHKLPRRGDREIEIHHFKWDASLPARVRQKLDAAGGDRDSIEGPSFIDEYRRLDRHLCEHGRVRLP